MMSMPDFPCRTPAIPCTDDAADEGVSTAHVLPMGVQEADRRRAESRVWADVGRLGAFQVAEAMHSYHHRLADAMADAGQPTRAAIYRAEARRWIGHMMDIAHATVAEQVTTPDIPAPVRTPKEAA